MKNTIRILAALSILFLLHAPAGFAQATSLQQLDRYMEEARTTWRIPGMSVAIIKDDKVVLARGYGLRELGKPEKVDEDTLFAIASNTKAFTAAALAALVDEGKLSWDDPVRKHLPWFRIYSPFVAEEIRVRDLLCHRSGLGTYSGDLLWYLTPYSRAEVVQRAGLLPAAGPFRAHYGYSNIMYIAAGEVLAAVSGTGWDEFIAARILQPLGMGRTVSSVKQLSGKGNVASPHADFDGELRVFPWASWDAMAAGGGIISSASDMARWLRLQLNRGALDGSRVFSERESRNMWTVHTPLPVGRESEQRHPSTHFRGYGLGWNLFDYLGEKVVSHGGAYDGMYSRTAMVPARGLGMVILTNSTTDIPTALMYRILDLYLGAPETDWSSDYLKRYREDRRRSREESAKRDAARVAGTRPSLDLEKYAGLYGGSMYGDARVSLENGALVLRFLPAPELTGELTHWHYDTFEVRWRRKFPWFDKGKVQFLLDAAGQVTEMKIDVPNEDFWFTELEFKRKAETGDRR